ncbi:hypothetical protein [Microbacterium sp. IEGM 1404]|uniref:hypothetical protein n=1 Tax=Microbacterium sp. IEGM 1404 TaxID=3047084 RepID=UPI0024B70A4D|nr:hypothetical protein [Microbacterium sp. IEGM 1404]MDI9890560.1 hypothetical protein [Microbacterium sp. IEGM 1404]
MTTHTPTLREAAARLRDASGPAAASLARILVDPDETLAATDLVDDAIGAMLRLKHSPAVTDLLSLAFGEAGELAERARERQPDRAALSFAGHRLARLLDAIDAVIVDLDK